AQPARAVLHRMQRHRVGERLVIRHRVALDGVGQRIHARAGGDTGRQIDAERWIDERDPGGDVRRAADIEFYFWVRDRGPEGDLPAGSRRSWDGDQGRDPRVNRILAPLVLTDAPAVHGDHADALCGVDRAAAADRDQAVAALRLVVTSPGIDECDPGVGPPRVVGNWVQAGGAERLEGLIEQPGLHDPLVGDDQRPLNVETDGL